MATDFTAKEPGSQPVAHLFGTDWMGRDMFTRTLAGLSLSIRIGLLTAAVSAGIGLAVWEFFPPRLEAGWTPVISWWIDLVMGIPHILLVILLSIACGRGFTGVVVGVALSHWTSLARVIRGEVLQLEKRALSAGGGEAGSVPLETGAAPSAAPLAAPVSHRIDFACSLMPFFMRPASPFWDLGCPRNSPPLA